MGRWNGDIGWPTQLTYYIQRQKPTQKKLALHNPTCTRSCWSAGTGTLSRGLPSSFSPTCLRTSTSRRSLSIWNGHSRCWSVSMRSQEDHLSHKLLKCFTNQALTFNYGRELDLTKIVCVTLKVKILLDIAAMLAFQPGMGLCYMYQRLHFCILSTFSIKVSMCSRTMFTLCHIVEFAKSFTVSCLRHTYDMRNRD